MSWTITKSLKTSANGKFITNSLKKKNVSFLSYSSEEREWGTFTHGKAVGANFTRWKLAFDKIYYLLHSSLSLSLSVTIKIHVHFSSTDDRRRRSGWFDMPNNTMAREKGIKMRRVSKARAWMENLHFNPFRFSPFILFLPPPIPPLSFNRENDSRLELFISAKPNLSHCGKLVEISQ